MPFLETNGIIPNRRIQNPINHRSDMVTLKTQRLDLREFALDDYSDLHRMGSNPDVRRYMGRPINTEQDTEEWVNHALENREETPRKEYQFVVILDSQFIGACDFNVHSWEREEGEVGYMLDTPYWGKGYATEISKELIRFGFTELGMHRIIAKCDSRNTASFRVMEKCGMKREAELRDYRKTETGWSNRLIYSILKHEWSPES